MKNKELARIVDDVLQNKEANFKKLFNATSETIYYMAYKILKDPNDAQDAAQEIMLYIYNHLEEVRSSQAFNQWMNKIIYGICNRSLSKILKAKDNLQEKEMESLLETNKDKLPEDYLEDLEEREALLNIVNSLSEKQRDVVLLYYYQGLSAKEVAEILDCSVAAVKDRLANAKKALRSKLKQSAHFGNKYLSGVSLVPIFTHAMFAESKDVYEGEAASHLWDNVSRHIALQARKSDKKGRYLFLSLIILAGMTVGLLSCWQTQKEREGSSLDARYWANIILNNRSIDLQIMEESDDETEDFETAMNQTVQGEDESNTLNEEPDSSSTDESIPTEEKTKMQSRWGEESQAHREEQSEALEDTNLITNMAILEDDQQDIVYEVPIDGNEQGDRVFGEDEVKITSNRTYHELQAPQLTFEKRGSRESGSKVEGFDVITYYVTVQNTGETDADSIYIKDSIPDDTSLVSDSETGNRGDISIHKEEVNGTKTIIWLIETLKPGESIVVSFQVIVNQMDEKGTRNIVNTAFVGSDNHFEKTNQIIYYQDNSEAETTFPKTGDMQHIMPAVILLLLSMCVLAVSIKKRQMYGGQK